MAQDTTLSFGFLPSDLDLQLSCCTIATRPDIADQAAWLREQNRVIDGWFYPPLEPRHDRFHKNSEPPLVPTVRFGLPNSHTISVPQAPGDGGDEVAEYLVFILGLAKGLKLLPQGWYHFYRVPIRSEMLSGFHASDAAVSAVLEAAHSFWQSHAKVRVLLVGALHWQVFSKCYGHWFESFDGQYRVVDTCFKICQEVFGLPAGTHAGRIPAMCSQLGLPVPTWAVQSKGKSELSRIRNRMVHEGLVGEHPTSYLTPPDALSVAHELGVFTVRLLMALVGFQSPSLYQLPLDHSEPFDL